jgi:hypothetical protein
MYRYKLHYQDGSEAGDAAYADNVNPGDKLMFGPGKFVWVLAVVAVNGEGLALRWDAAGRAGLTAQAATTRSPREATVRVPGGCASGSEIANEVPTFGSLVMLIVPSWASMIALTIGRPRPVP